jgi:hypothetical protein
MPRTTADVRHIPSMIARLPGCGYHLGRHEVAKGSNAAGDGKVCLDFAKSARLTVRVLSTTDFNLFLLVLSTICSCPSRLKERSWPEITGI